MIVGVPVFVIYLLNLSGWRLGAAVLIYIYLLPPLLYKLLYLFFKKEFGKHEFFSNKFLLWWLGAQLQIIYTRLTFLEEFLRFFPFVYSAWLRLWGSKIGKRVYWSPRVVVIDRGDLEIGNDCIIGYGAEFTAHLLIKHKNAICLHHEKIVIGKNVIVGAECKMALGVKALDGTTIKALSVCTPFSKIV